MSRTPTAVKLRLGLVAPMRSGSNNSGRVVAIRELTNSVNPSRLSLPIGVSFCE